MKKSIFLVLFLFLCSYTVREAKPAYQIFDKNGRKISYEEMLKTLRTKELVFFGELHDNAVAHKLELEVLKDLYPLRSLILGAEMFEADNQAALNAYLHDSINAEALDTLARLWDNYQTDYRPLVDFAKAHQIPFVATNIPRRYARMVNKGGFEALDTLPAAEKNWIAPLPIVFDPELPSYQNILKMMGDHGTPTIVKAQASKDATMAWFIMQNMKPNTLFLHFNGSYHSDDYEGIVWYVKQKNPQVNLATISTVTQANLSSLKKQYKGKADFVIVADENIMKSY